MENSKMKKKNLAAPAGFETQNNLISITSYLSKTVKGLKSYPGLVATYSSVGPYPNFASYL